MADLPNIELEDGNLFVIDKPLGWTSFDVVKKVRNALGIKKVGHAGTLDPLATGILVVCSGKKTKMIDGLMAQQKQYTATLKLGFTTPSYDAETAEVPAGDYAHLSLTTIREAITQFLGDIEQYPPVFSAIKIDGKRLYEFARAGQEVELKKRPVTIAAIEITALRLPYLDLVITCSKGTYIRSLAHDIGQVLGCGAYLTALRRTRNGNLDISQALNLDSLVAHIRQATGRTQHPSK